MTVKSRSGVLREARNVIEENLGDPDLSPALIARTLGVSLRTLHRAFSMSDDSVMSFARRRRLERAHGDLVRADNPAGISEIAARWHFSDASHFIRNYKSFYGATPAAHLRRVSRSGVPRTRVALTFYGREAGRATV
ncbi:helix-turn-helix domain-containing protein [Streptomyces beigongshangae]|uniref:helix-turn-helix domain-containing protein n=1 Tax=Streptomyces beigongshangae TaxID=2841597 RepID=UPI0021A2DDA6|nr:helix-turn-helix domain-containing protein [Streptomyces sp. REN17]